MNGLTETDVVGMVMIAVLIALMLIVQVKDMLAARRKCDPPCRHGHEAFGPACTNEGCYLEDADLDTTYHYNEDGVYEPDWARFDEDNRS